MTSAVAVDVIGSADTSVLCRVVAVLARVGASAIRLIAETAGDVLSIHLVFEATDRLAEVIVNQIWSIYGVVSVLRTEATPA